MEQQPKLLGTDTEGNITCEIRGYRKDGICYMKDIINKRTEDCEQQPKRGDGCDHNYENFSSKFSQPEDGGICCATFVCRRCGDFQVKKRIADKLGIPVEDLIIKDI